MGNAVLAGTNQQRVLTAPPWQTADALGRPGVACADLRRLKPSCRAVADVV